ncbi:MAG TPA: hypothetical protein VIL26_04590 [Clostridia bacterium]
MKQKILDFFNIKDTLQAIKKRIWIFRLVSGIIILALTVLMIVLELIVSKGSISNYFDVTNHLGRVIFAWFTLGLRLLTVGFAFYVLVIGGYIKNKKTKRLLYLISIILKTANVISIFIWGTAENIIWGLISLIPIGISIYSLVMGIVLDRFLDYIKTTFSDFKQTILIKKGDYTVSNEENNK